MTVTAETKINSPELASAPWDEIRTLFALDQNIIHLNTGTMGALPHAVLEANDSVTREWTGGLMNVYPPGMYTEHREIIGRAFGVDGDEMVICHNATEGVSRVINGLDLHEGDEVLTTTHECYSVLSNFNLLRNRHGVKVNTITLPSGWDVSPEQIISLFENAITPNTKVIAFSGITLFTGTMLPIRAICRLAQQHGITTVIDGALLPGAININFREMGADFISCSGSKFQCGPLGTGILYIRNKVYPEFNPNPLPTIWPIISTWYPMAGEPPPRTTTSVASCNIGDYFQSAGSASIARGASLATASKLWDSIGRQRIQERIYQLADYARQRLVETFGKERIYSPEHERLKSPLIAFHPFEASSDAWNVKKFMAYVQRLEDDHRIWIRWTEFDVPRSPHQHYAARICTHLFNNEFEVDEAIATMSALAKEM